MKNALEKGCQNLDAAVETTAVRSIVLVLPENCQLEYSPVVFTHWYRSHSMCFWLFYNWDLWVWLLWF